MSPSDMSQEHVTKFIQDAQTGMARAVVHRDGTFCKAIRGLIDAYESGDSEAIAKAKDFALVRVEIVESNDSYLREESARKGLDEFLQKMLEAFSCDGSYTTG